MLPLFFADIYYLARLRYYFVTSGSAIMLFTPCRRFVCYAISTPIFAARYACAATRCCLLRLPLSFRHAAATSRRCSFAFAKKVLLPMPLTFAIFRLLLPPVVCRVSARYRRCSPLRRRDTRDILSLMAAVDVACSPYFRRHTYAAFPSHGCAHSFHCVYRLFFHDAAAR